MNINPNSKRYEIQWFDQLFPGKKGADVFEDGNQIGKVKNVGFQGIKSKFSFYDNNDSLVLSLYQRRGGLSSSMDFDDENGNHLGICSGGFSMGFSRDNKAKLKDPNGKSILIAIGNNRGMFYMVKNFQIKDSNDIDVAKCSVKYETIRPQKKGFLNKLRTKDKTTCFLKVIDEGYDRKILLGFFISCVDGLNTSGAEGASAG